MTVMVKKKYPTLGHTATAVVSVVEMPFDVLELLIPALPPINQLPLVI